MWKLFHYVCLLGLHKMEQVLCDAMDVCLESVSEYTNGWSDGRLACERAEGWMKVGRGGAEESGW